MIEDKPHAVSSAGDRDVDHECVAGPQGKDALKARAEQTHRVCRTCGAGFTVKAYRIAKGEGVFCTHACYVADLRTRFSAPTEKRCPKCGVVKQAQDFYPGRRLSPWCRACTCAAHRVWQRRDLPLPADIKSRITGSVAITEAGCWEWSGVIRQNGYAAITVNGRVCLTHRVSYRAFKGEIAAGLTIDHLCFNRRCVNPDHLEAVPQAINVQRANARKRVA